MSHLNLRVLLLCACVAGAAGCSTTAVREYNAYASETLATDEVAFLHVPNDIMVDDIDGNGRYFPLLELPWNRYGGALIRLLPGPHSADVIYHSRYWFTSDTQTVSFEVEAGRHYEIRAEITEVDYLKQAAFEIVPRQAP